MDREGTHEGLAARARGQCLGRPPAMNPEQIRHARALLTQPDATIASIALFSEASGVTTSPPWLGITTPPWLKESGTLQSHGTIASVGATMWNAVP